MFACSAAVKPMLFCALLPHALPFFGKHMSWLPPYLPHKSSLDSSPPEGKTFPRPNGLPLRSNGTQRRVYAKVQEVAKQRLLLFKDLPSMTILADTKEKRRQENVTEGFMPMVNERLMNEGWTVAI